MTTSRYKKRGISDKGHVANDVESEQIVSCGNRYTSYVQMRASIPLFWTQEGSAMKAKPKIEVPRDDTFSLALRYHLMDLYRRYGFPLVVVNLVKQGEREKRESIIGSRSVKRFLFIEECPLLTRSLERFGRAVEYVNQFIEEKSFKIEYIAWDFKR